MRQDWASREFESIDLGDTRLNSRFQRVSQRLYEKPTASINEACGSWSDTKAAYRLFSNPKVTSEEILSSHRQQILERIREEQVIYAIQDTTFFNYHSQRARTDMGVIESNHRPLRGLLAHNVLITTERGVPLGLFYQKIYARNPKEVKPKWYERDFEEKESYRWAESVHCLGKCLPPQTRCVVVADREADIFEHLQACQSNNLDFVIRSCSDRVVGIRKKRWEPGSDTYLVDFLDHQKIEHKIALEVRDKRLNRTRIAHLNLKFCHVVFPAPWRMDTSIDGPSQKHPERAVGSRAKVEAYAVEVKEHHPPKGAGAISWRLITSVPVHSTEEALKILAIYSKRWAIEVFHKVLKSGCRVEECRLGTRENLSKFLTLCSVVAWKLHWMTQISRESPAESCMPAFSRQEWKTIYRSTHPDRALPKEAPTLHEVLRWMAQMGGFLARKGDGEPGIVTVWRGWKNLTAILRAQTYG